jgi:fucose 4-O-acetylase-like acetyltransferase
MQKATSKARIPYLDFLKFFAIASVLLGHSVEQTTGNDFWDNPIWAFIYTYHMPLFMLLCGYFFGSSLKLSFVDVFKKKFVQLGIPSISAWVLMWLFVKLTGYNPYPEIVDLSWLGFMNAMWFLKCVFFCYLIGWVFVKAMRNVWIAAFASVVLTHLVPVFSIDSVNFMLPMFWAGYLCNLHQSWIDRHRIGLLVVSVLAFGVMLPFWSGRLTVYMVPIDFFHWDTFQFDMANFGVALYRMAIGLVGSMVFFLLSPDVYSWIRNWRITPVLDKLGKCTLGLYWTQTFLLECTWHSIGLYVGTEASFIVAPVIALAEMVICYQAVLLLRKNRYTRLVFLGEQS